MQVRRRLIRRLFLSYFRGNSPAHSDMLALPVARVRSHVLIRHVGENPNLLLNAEAHGNAADSFWRRRTLRGSRGLAADAAAPAMRAESRLTGARRVRGLVGHERAFDDIVARLAHVGRDVEAARIEQLASVAEHRGTAADHDPVGCRIKRRQTQVGEQTP